MSADYPASCIVHWATGPVPCCDDHARALIGLGRFLGTHVAATSLTEPSQCTNCVNEAKDPK